MPSDIQVVCGHNYAKRRGVAVVLDSKYRIGNAFVYLRIAAKNVVTLFGGQLLQVRKAISAYR